MHAIEVKLQEFSHKSAAAAFPAKKFTAVDKSAEISVK